MIGNMVLIDKYENNMNDIFKKMNPFHQMIHGQIDKLSSTKMCHVCHESYLSIIVVRGFEGPIF